MKPKEVEANIRAIRDIFEPMIEAGVFVGHGHVADEIADKLALAGRLVANHSLPEAMAFVLTAEARLNGQVRTKSWWWRVCHLHMLPLFLYHLAWVVGVAWWWPRSGCLQLPVPTECLLLGVLGSQLRGIYWLQFQVGRRIFRPTNVLAHIASPFIGALLALIVYLLTKLGLVVLRASEKTAVDPQANLIPLTVAFLSGFKWEWVMGKLDQIFAGEGSGGK